MIIVLGFYRKKASLSYERFCNHWRNVHGPLFVNTPELAKYFKRYVQHHLRPNTIVPGYAALEFDGFSESWFESVDERRKFLAEPKLKELIVPDEEKFIDTKATRTQMLDAQYVQIG